MLHSSYNQVKPWSGGVPRLKRSHPLARNLLTYMVDTGHGVFDIANPSAQTNFQSRTYNPPTDLLNVVYSPRQSGINGPSSGWSGFPATISIASPAVITMTNTFAAGQQVLFLTSGTLPTGITAATAYFVIAASLSGSSFEISATSGGAAINTSGSQSGTQYVVPLDSQGEAHTSAIIVPDRTTTWSNLSGLGTGAGFSFASACIYRGEGPGPGGGGAIYLSPVHANEGGQPFMNWQHAFNGTTHGLVDAGGYTTSGNYAAYGTSFQTTAFQYTSLLTTLVNVSSAPTTVTISIASPAVVTMTNTFAAGQPVVFGTSGSLPTGLTAGISYYVISAGLSGSSFEVSATVGGAAINTSGTQSGTQTVTAITATGRLYANGALSGSAVSGLAPTNSTATPVRGADAENQLMLGSVQHVQTSVSFFLLNGLVFYGACWNRTLSAGEARLLHKFPWCMLETGNLRPVLDF